MKTQLRYTVQLGIIILLTISLFSSCGTDKEDMAPVAEGQDYRDVLLELKNDLEKIDVPAGLKNSKDEYASMTYAHYSSLKLYTSFMASYLVIPSYAKQVESKIGTESFRVAEVANAGTYTWSTIGGSIKYTIKEAATGFEFSYIHLQSSSSHEVLSGFSTKDNSYSEIILHGEDGEGVLFKINRLPEKILLEMLVKSESSTVILENSLVDHTGSLKVYANDGSGVESMWDATGSGRATISDGTKSETYTWH